MKRSGCDCNHTRACAGCACRKRSPLPRRVALGKIFKGITYQPQYALGILCADERDQAKLHTALRRSLTGREIKVLVI